MPIPQCTWQGVFIIRSIASWDMCIMDLQRNCSCPYKPIKVKSTNLHVVTLFCFVLFTILMITKHPWLTCTLHPWHNIEMYFLRIKINHFRQSACLESLPVTLMIKTSSFMLSNCYYEWDVKIISSSNFNAFTLTAKLSRLVYLKKRSFQAYPLMH